MSRFTALASSVLILAAAGCASRQSHSPPAVAAQVPAEGSDAASTQLATPEGPVIVRLVGHNHPTITVTSSPEGPRYSAQANDGRVIVRGATLEELQANHPELAKFVQPTIAVHADAGDVVPEPAGSEPVELDTRREAPAGAIDARR